MKKFISFFLAVLLLLSVIPVYAADAPQEATEHVFTKAELANAATFDTSKLLTTSDGFIPINLIEGNLSRSSTTSTTYYIVKKDDGNLLTSPSAGRFSQTRYSDGNSNSHSLQKWIFTDDGDGNYIVYSNTDQTKCLTVVPSTGNVKLSGYIGSDEQKWGMYYSSEGNALQSMSTDSRVSGYKLAINSTSCSVSNSNYTRVGFLDVSWYVPCTAMSVKKVVVDAGANKYVSETYTPSSANVTSGSWAIYTSAATDIFTVNTAGRVTGKDAGIATITVQDKITGVTGTANVYVTRLPNPNAQNKTNWCWVAAAKMVGEHNGGSGSLNTGATLLSNTEGKLTYNNKPFFGETSTGAYTVDSGQRQIVVAIHGDDGNHTGSSANIDTALEMAAANSVTIGTVGQAGRVLTSDEINIMNAELAAGRWVVASLHPTGGGTGHTVVIQSYDSSSEQYTFWNPNIDEIDYFTKTRLLNQRIVLESPDGSAAYYTLSYFKYCRQE